VVASWRSNAIDLQVGTQMYEAAFGVRPPTTKFKDSNWLASRIHEAFRLGHLVLLIDPRIDYKSPTQKPQEIEEPEEAPAKPVPSQKKGLEWFRTRLLDEDGKPMAGEEYVVVGSDGAKREGRLDANGEMSIPEILPPGDCSVTFPKIHLNPRKKK
jgi:hypothetical protein